MCRTARSTWTQTIGFNSRDPATLEQGDGNISWEQSDLGKEKTSQLTEPPGYTAPKQADYSHQEVHLGMVREAVVRPHLYI